MAFEHPLIFPPTDLGGAGINVPEGHEQLGVDHLAPARWCCLERGLTTWKLCGTMWNSWKIPTENCRGNLENSFKAVQLCATMCNYVQLCATSKLHVGFHASSRGSMGNHWAETSEPNEKQYGKQMFRRGIWPHFCRTYDLCSELRCNWWLSMISCILRPDIMNLHCLAD